MNRRELDRAYHTWMAEQAAAGTPLFPAATVVLLRDTVDGLQVLLLRRNVEVKFAGGLWVFPGGRIDPGDHPPGRDDLIGAARQAGAREAREEAGLRVAPESLIWFSHWAPPPTAPKRFATFFFAGRTNDAEVRIDGSEIHDHAWLAPGAALAHHRAREVDLAPPTFVTLHYLSQSPDVAHALDRLDRHPPRFYETCVARRGPLTCFLWEPDAGYPAADPDVPGPRHRITVTSDGWVLDDSGHPLPP